MLQRLRFVVHVVNGVRLRVALRGSSGHDAAAEMNGADALGTGVQVCRYASSEIDCVADQPLVRVLQRRHQGFARVRAALKNGDRSAVESLAGRICQLGSAHWMTRATVGVDEQLARADLLLQERQHGRLTRTHSHGMREAIFEQVGELTRRRISGHAALFRRASELDCI
jgi:hypothetical protein